MDIKQFRNFLTKANPNNLKEAAVVGLDIGGSPKSAVRISSLSDLMKEFKVVKISDHSPLDSLKAAQAIKAGKTLYAYIDPYTADVGNSDELVIHLSKQEAIKAWNDSSGDI